MDLIKWHDGKSWSRIEIDCRDGSKDAWIPTKDAKRLYQEGRLNLNLTNFGVYCTPVLGQNNMPEIPIRRF